MVVHIDRKPNRGSVRHSVLLGLFTGTAVGAGYLLVGVPNVELMTLIIVLSGAALGPVSGLACGMIAASIFSLGSPYGVPAPLLLAAQAVGLGLAGAVGQVAAGRILQALRKRRRVMGIVLAGGTGLFATLLYDGLTNLAIIGAFDLEPIVVLWGAVPFFLIHGGVNTFIFAALLPLVLPRLLGLARSPLSGRAAGQTAVVLMAMMFVPQAAPGQESDNTVSDGTATDTSAAQVDNPLGWQRPVWTPFLGTVIEELNHRSPFIPMVDGGLGSSVMLLGRSGTSPGPLFVRDGIPLGTGHALADDPWLIPMQGSAISYSSSRDDQWGGTAGSIGLDPANLAPEQAVSVYGGRKGPHETYLRGISLMSPQADWRFTFDFEESLDNEGYNFTELPEEEFRSVLEFPGHAKIRTSHASLTRRLNEASRLTFHYHTGRKTKDSLPVWGTEHQEVWDSGLGVRAEGRSGPWTWGTTWFWNDCDVKWGDRMAFAGYAGELRMLETAREGGSLELQRPLGSVRLGLRGNFRNWEVHDTGVSWLDEGHGELGGDGQQSVLRGSLDLPVGPWRLVSEMGTQWDSRCEWAPAWSLQLGPGGAVPGWSLAISRDGRTPRSDEWLTPVVRQIGSREVFLLPNSELEREDSLRAGFLWRKRILGIEFALDGGWDRLREGIAWSPLVTDPQSGIWRNELDLDSRRFTGSLTRKGRLFGWLTARLEGTWQDFDEKAGRASFLPPKQFHRLHLMWENHYFDEDGILQLALLSTRRGAMTDPWDVSRSAFLPSATIHDLVVGFRLMGAHLSLAYRNLTSSRVRLSSGALSTGRERDMRLYWVFLQ